MDFYFFYWIWFTVVYKTRDKITIQSTHFAWFTLKTIMVHWIRHQRQVLALPELLICHQRSFIWWFIASFRLNKRKWSTIKKNLKYIWLVSGEFISSFAPTNQIWMVFSTNQIQIIFPANPIQVVFPTNQKKPQETGVNWTDSDLFSCSSCFMHWFENHRASPYRPNGLVHPFDFWMTAA